MHPPSGSVRMGRNGDGGRGRHAVKARCGRVDSALLTSRSANQPASGKLDPRNVTSRGRGGETLRLLLLEVIEFTKDCISFLISRFQEHRRTPLPKSMPHHHLICLLRYKDYLCKLLCEKHRMLYEGVSSFLKASLLK